MIHKLINDEIASGKSKKALSGLIFKDKTIDAAQGIISRLTKGKYEGGVPPVDVLEKVAEYFNVKTSQLLEEIEPVLDMRGSRYTMFDDDYDCIEPFLDHLRYVSKKGSNKIRRKLMSCLIDFVREVGEEELSRIEDDDEQKKLTCSTSARQTSTQQRERKVA